MPKAGAYLLICPSLRRMLLICDRNSGSCVEGVYVEAAFGTRTGVVGSEAIVLVASVVSLWSTYSVRGTLLIIWMKL